MNSGCLKGPALNRGKNSSRALVGILTTGRLNRGGRSTFTSTSFPGSTEGLGPSLLEMRLANSQLSIDVIRVEKSLFPSIDNLYLFATFLFKGNKLPVSNWIVVAVASGEMDYSFS